MNDVQRNMADEWQTTQHSRELSQETKGEERTALTDTLERA